MRVRLDGTFNVGLALVIGYRFTDDAADKWTSRFNAFKAGDARAVRAALAVSNTALAEVAPPKGPIIVVGVPGSGEEMLNPARPVGQLSAAVAGTWNAQLDLTLIRKTPHAPIHTQRRLEARRALLDQAQYQAVRSYEDVGTFVIVDDFITRGDTMQRIASCLYESHPHAGFAAYAVAKTENLQFWRDVRGVMLDNTRADRFEQVWNENCK
jgi:predicted amidophosphoribosyltransferase